MANVPDRWAVESAVKRSDLPPPSRHIILTLLTHVTNGTLTIPSEYSPSLSALVKETGYGRGTVAEHLNRLEGEGWVTRFRPTTKQALAKRARTSYRITIPKAVCTSPGAGPVREPDQSESRTGQEEAQVRTSPGAELVREPDGTSPGAGHNPMSSPTSSSPTEKKKGGAGGRQRPNTSQEHPRFAEWYAAYPAKKARGQAVKAFNAAVAKVDDVQILIDGAVRYRDTDPYVARGYIKNPATWLNGECWDDEPTPLQATGTDGAYGHGPRARVNDHDWSKGGPTV